jgi:predicted DCC family thiol-disulfide oxidoreductase YuxK
MNQLGFVTSSVEPHRRTRTVLYDGGCGLCSGVVTTMRRLDVLKRIEYLDVVNDWDTIGRRYPQLSREACLTDMHVIDDRGRVLIGFEGYRSLAWVIPLAWLTIPFLYVPGVPAIGRRVYRYVADHRSRNTCALP